MFSQPAHYVDQVVTAPPPCSLWEIQMIHGIIRLLVHSLLLLQANHATRLLKRICLMFHSKIELCLVFNDFYRFENYCKKVVRWRLWNYYSGYNYSNYSCLRRVSISSKNWPKVEKCFIPTFGKRMSQGFYSPSKIKLLGNNLQHCLIQWGEKQNFVQLTDKKFVHLLLCIHFLNSLQITSSLGHSKPTHPVICQSKRVFSMNSKSCFFYLLQVCQRANCRSLFCFLLSDSDTLEKTAPSGTRCAS